jgi:hypothetical protein
VVIWGLLLIIPALIFRNVTVNTGLPDNFFLFTNAYHIVLFYLNAYYLYPKFFNKKTWWLYLFFIDAIITVSYYTKLFLIRLADPSFQLNSFNERIVFFPPLAFLIASFIFRVILNRIHFEKLEKERKAERLASELKFLRSQVNPHFLFNMMTNMVSLARQKSDLLEPSLLKLSDLLRYMLYESGHEKFRVSQEIVYLKAYIELQQLRFGEDINMELDIKEDGPDCYIEPMLLVPFVENAFKHGIGMLEHPFIRIQLQLKDQQLFFSIMNNYNRGNLSKDKYSGIGLDNVKNRLQLLYPGKYELEIKDQGELYKIELKLDLT